MKTAKELREIALGWREDKKAKYIPHIIRDLPEKMEQSARNGSMTTVADFQTIDNQNFWHDIVSAVRDWVDEHEGLEAHTSYSGNILYVGWDEA